MTTCANCNQTFEITDKHRAFYVNLHVPAPKICPSCRLQRKLTFRNERVLYKRSCDATGKEMVSIYSPDKKMVVYNKEYWHGDDWNPLALGRDYDPTRSFFEQFGELLHETPVPNVLTMNNIASEYVNHSANCDHCYMTMLATNNKDCVYGKNIHDSFRCIDNTNINHCQDCYENVFGLQNNTCYWLYESENCYDCHFSSNLTSCTNCILCTNLSHKEYMIRNQQVTPEEFAAFKATWDVPACQREFEKIRQERICLYGSFPHSEDCTGNNLVHCTDCLYSFDAENCENSEFLSGNKGIRDSMDLFALLDAEQMYDCTGGMFGSSRVCWSILPMNLHESFFTYFCQNGDHLFGCVSTRNSSYCILNKQYTKEEYEALRTRIIADMEARGEWGYFIDPLYSPLGYNESVAHEYFPLTKEQASGKFQWHEEINTRFEGEGYTPHNDVQAYRNQLEAEHLLNGVILCTESGRPFKITPQELSFCLEGNLPIPRLHPDIRHKKRFTAVLPPRLWRRACMNPSRYDTMIHCTNTFETAYAPHLPQRVYCADCYKHTVL